MTLTHALSGLPFALFWITLWVLLSALIMAIVYRLDR